jgi:hypothetical protein
MSILVNAYCTHLQPPELTFPHKLNGRRDLSDPELADHLNGFHGYIQKSGGQEMTKVNYHLHRHIQRVKHQLSFDIEEDDLDALAAWSLDSNAILFLPDGTIRSPTGNVLLYPDGSPPEDDAEIPFLPKSHARRSNTEKMLQERNIPIPSLPPLACELELQLRRKEEIFQRAMALFVVALHAESLATNDPIDINELKERIPIGFDALTPLEQAFVYNETNTEQEVIQFAWRYEALTLLLWALNLIQNLPFPSTICDVPAVARTSLDWASWKDSISLRPISEVLDALDLHYRLHWLSRQGDLDGRDLPFALDGGVVQERHYALNWLISFENAEWDDVDTPT